MKHAKNFTNQEHEKKEITGCVHFYENGRVFMTNSIVAVLARNAHKSNESYTTDLDGKHTEYEVYKSYERFFRESSEHIIIVDVKELLNTTQAFQALGKIIGNKRDKLTANSFYLTVEDKKAIAKYDCENVQGNTTLNDNYDEEFTVKIATENAIKALKLLKDLKIETCAIGIDGKLSPVIFADPFSSIEIIVLPIQEW